MVTSPVVQTSTAGDVTVEVDLPTNQATMRQLPPVFGPEVTDRDAVANAAGLQASDLVDGLPVVSASTGLAHLMVPVKDEATLRRAERDDRGCGEVCAATNAESLYLFAVRGDGDVMARMFDRGIDDRGGPRHGFGRGSTGRLPVGTRTRGHAGEGRRWRRARWCADRASSTSRSNQLQTPGRSRWPAACGSWAKARSRSERQTAGPHVIDGSAISFDGPGSTRA